MGIVYYSGHSFLRANRFQSASNTLQRTEHQQDILGALAQHHCGTIDCQQIADIELSNKLHPNLTTIDLQIHALKMALYDTGTEVSHRPGTVGLHLCLAVLNHHAAVLVISIRNGKGVFR